MEEPKLNSLEKMSQSLGTTYTPDVKNEIAEIKKETKSLTKKVNQPELKDKEYIVEQFKNSDDLVYSLERSLYIRNDELNKKIKRELGYYNSSDPEVKDKIDKMVKDVYFNSNEEYNAYYLSAIYKFLTYLNSLNKKDLERAFQYIDGTPVGMMTTFNRFKNRFVLSYLQSFDKFNNIYQRRILKRLYDFYVNIRSVLEAKLKEEKLGG